MRQYLVSKAKLRSLCTEISDDDGQPSTSSRVAKISGLTASVPPGEPNCRDPRPQDGPGYAGKWRRRSTRCWLNAATVILQGLRVASVEPFPDASRLLVTVRSSTIDREDRPTSGRAGPSPLCRAATCGLRLRRAVTRKRAPLLMYRLAEGAEVGIDR